MLLNARDLQGLPIRATDGELGKVDEFLFDDRSWGVRYLVVDTGPWLLGQQVLIAPASIGAVDWGAGWLPVNLTREQVENSPSIESHLPVSRQHEEELSQYYGWPAYWGEAGPGNWITVYANSGHAYAVIAGLRWDTSGTGGDGPSWSTSLDGYLDTSSYTARHPAGF